MDFRLNGRHGRARHRTRRARPSIFRKDEVGPQTATRILARLEWSIHDSQAFERGRGKATARSGPAPGAGGPDANPYRAAWPQPRPLDAAPHSVHRRIEKCRANTDGHRFGQECTAIKEPVPVRPPASGPSSNRETVAMIECVPEKSKITLAWVIILKLARGGLTP